MTLLFLLVFAIIFVSFCLYMISRTQSLFSAGQKPVCDNCSFPLKIQDQLPLYSWISLRGKCRYCNSSLPLHYLLWEFAGLVFILVASYFLGLSTTLLLLTLTLIAVIDVKTGRIPTIFVLICAVLALFIMGLQNIFPAIVMVLTGHLIHQLLPNPPLGRGDIKFLGMAGLWISFSQLPLFLVLTGLGGVITSLLLRQRVIPLGPALGFSLGTCVLLGKQINFFEEVFWFIPFFA